MTNDEIAAWRILSNGLKCQSNAKGCQHFSRSQSTIPFVTNCVCCGEKYGISSHVVATRFNCDGSPV